MPLSRDVLERAAEMSPQDRRDLFTAEERREIREFERKQRTTAQEPLQAGAVAEAEREIEKEQREREQRRKRAREVVEESKKRFEAKKKREKRRLQLKRQEEAELKGIIGDAEDEELTQEERETARRVGQEIGERAAKEFQDEKELEKELERIVGEESDEPLTEAQKEKAKKVGREVADAAAEEFEKKKERKQVARTTKKLEESTAARREVVAKRQAALDFQKQKVDFSNASKKDRELREQTIVLPSELEELDVGQLGEQQKEFLLGFVPILGTKRAADQLTKNFDKLSTTEKVTGITSTTLSALGDVVIGGAAGKSLLKLTGKGAKAGVVSRVGTESADEAVNLAQTTSKFSGQKPTVVIRATAGDRVLEEIPKLSSKLANKNIAKSIKNISVETDTTASSVARAVKATKGLEKTGKSTDLTIVVEKGTSQKAIDELARIAEGGGVKNVKIRTVTRGKVSDTDVDGLARTLAKERKLPASAADDIAKDLKATFGAADKKAIQQTSKNLSKSLKNKGLKVTSETEEISGKAKTGKIKAREIEIGDDAPPGLPKQPKGGGAPTKTLTKGGSGTVTESVRVTKGGRVVFAISPQVAKDLGITGDEVQLPEQEQIDEPSVIPGKEPTKEPEKKPDKAPTKEPEKEPAKKPDKEPVKEPVTEPTPVPEPDRPPEPGVQPKPEPEQTTEPATQPETTPERTLTTEPGTEVTAETATEPAEEVETKTQTQAKPKTAQQTKTGTLAEKAAKTPTTKAAQFRLPGGKELPPGVFPERILIPMGIVDRILDLDTGESTFRKRKTPFEGDPVDGLRVLSTDDDKPPARRFKQGLFTLRVFGGRRPRLTFKKRRNL